MEKHKYIHTIYIFAHNVLVLVKKMVTMTLAVPKELKNKMEEHPEINWSEVARQAFKQKLKDLEFLREFKKDSSMTEEEALKLGKKMKRELAKRYLDS